MMFQNKGYYFHNAEFANVERTMSKKKQCNFEKIIIQLYSVMHEIKIEIVYTNKNKTYNKI